MPNRQTGSEQLGRRRWLQCATGLAGAVALGGGAATQTLADEPRAGKSRLKQSIVHWCFQKHWNIEETCAVAEKLGCVSVELVDPKHWPTLRKHGLVCAIASSHGFEKGMNNP